MHTRRCGSLVRRAAEHDLFLLHVKAGVYAAAGARTLAYRARVAVDSDKLAAPRESRSTTGFNSATTAASAPRAAAKPSPRRASAGGTCNSIMESSTTALARTYVVFALGLW